MAKGNPRRKQKQNRTRERVKVRKNVWHRNDGKHERFLGNAKIDEVHVARVVRTTEAIFSTHDARARSKSKRRRARKERRTRVEA